MKVSVVIAAYDERDNIEVLTRRLTEVLRSIPETRYEIVFVIEGRDGTREIAEKLAGELGEIRVLYNERPSGLGTAFRRGFAAVSTDADYVVTMDADLNHSPEEIPRLLEELRRRDLDILIGSRFIPGSRNEGIPVWKWTLSILMNRLIASLFDVESRDKTSGFRVYRAGALAKLTGYRNGDFAFLPEMLIRATEIGLRVGEAPIHFRFRTRGESKMSIGQTSRSYLVLLRSRFDGWSIAALAFLAAGILLRLLYAFPVHKYIADADSLLAPMRALDILGGKLRVFYSYVRIGAFESYLHAAAFAIFGVSREAIAIAPILSAVLSMLAFFFLVRELFGRSAACMALLFFALPTNAYVTWTYMPNGYPETMLFCVSTLYFASRIARVGPTPGNVALFGLSAGLGFWNSIQTLVCSAPAALWVLGMRGRDFVKRPALLVAGLTTALLGASPWIAYNVRYSFPSLHESYPTRMAPTSSAVLSNLGYLANYDLPELTVAMDTLGGSPNRVERALRPAAAAIFLLAAVAFLFLPLERERRGEPGRVFRLSSFVLLWLVAAAVVVVVILSEAGSGRGYTVRYVLPLYIVLACTAGLFVHALWRRSRVAGLAVAFVLLSFCISGYYFPWTERRHYLRQLLRFDEEAVSTLDAQGVRWVCGDYWIVYPLTFETRKRVLGIPTVPDYDHYGFAQALPRTPVPWALVARDPEWLRRWVASARLRGQIDRAGEGYAVFLPASDTQDVRPPRETAAALQHTAPAGGF